MSSGTKRKRMSAGKRKKRKTADTRSSSNIRRGGLTDLNLRFFDKTLGATTVPTTGAVFNPSSNGQFLNSVPDASGPSARTNNRIIMKSVQVRGRFDRDVHGSLTGPGNAMVMDIFLIMDLSPNGAIPTVPEIFSNAVAGEMLQNIGNSQRFIILKRKTLTMDCPNMAAVASVGTGGQYRSFKMFKKLNHEVAFTGTSDAVGSVSKKSLSIVAIASENAIPNTVALRYTSRIRYSVTG